MCELFGVTAGRKVRINELLKTFYSHSSEHSNGWGIALLDREPAFIKKESRKALNSRCLKKILKSSIETAGCLAHIRKATIGEVKTANSHPFSGVDASGRRWVLVHNGTIFDSDHLSPYQYVQEGSTDSERILLFIVDEAGKLCRRKGGPLSEDERIRLIEDTILKIVPGNKLDLLISDGELLYIHKNEAGTLYEKDLEYGVVFSTRPLDNDAWKEVPGNQLMVYRNGSTVYAGKKHGHTYVYDEEKMKPLYLAYSGL